MADDAALTVGSLFSGIGGLEYGLERTGKFRTIWQCEIEPYPSAVLAEHFPSVPNLGDITKVRWGGVPKPDLICGGFPCQDISVAGKGKGIIEGTRSGLWSEFARCLRTLRPRYALVENVPMLAKRGLWLVLADLAEMGYDAEWQIISAAECGAPHRRERLFVIARHADSCRCGAGNDNREGRQVLRAEKREDAQDKQARNRRLVRTDAGTETDAPDTKRDGVEGNAEKPFQGFAEFKVFKDIRRIEDLRNRPDIPEPLICRARDGLSSRLDGYIWKERIKALGNSVVPACAEICGRKILELVKDGK